MHLERLVVEFTSSVPNVNPINISRYLGTTIFKQLLNEVDYETQATK